MESSYSPGGGPARRHDHDRRALWVCPACARTFAQRNQNHTCAPLGDLDRHFAASAPHVRETFDRALAVVTRLGPVDVLAERTRIALHVRMSFAAFAPRRLWLTGHLVLAREVPSARFRKVEVFSPRNVLHAFRLDAPDDVDAEFAGWLAEAYRVGEQCHRPGGHRPRGRHPRAEDDASH
jgi:hypothetical protein